MSGGAIKGTGLPINNSALGMRIGDSVDTCGARLGLWHKVVTVSFAAGA